MNICYGSGSSFHTKVFFFFLILAVVVTIFNLYTFFFVCSKEDA